MKYLTALFIVLICGCESTPPPENPTTDTSADTDWEQRYATTTAASQQLPEAATSCATADADGDGFPADHDCNDTDDHVYPGAYELCDYIDNDCNGKTDETWEQLFHEFWGRPCSATAMNHCVSPGIWTCDDSHDWIACNAPPREPSMELCNDIDDDCDGITDTDVWSNLHTCCAGSSSTSTFLGTWECDLDQIGVVCAPNFEETTPAACEE